MEIKNLNNYGYVESTEFNGLMPKVMEDLPSIGASVIPSGATVNNLAAAPLEVVDAVGIMQGLSGATC